MRKLLAFLSILAMASAASGLPYFTVDAADQKDHYQPSDWITIDLVDDGQVVGFMIDCITDNPGGVAIGTSGEPQVFNTGLQVALPGVLNSEGQLVAWVSAYNINVPQMPSSGILYSFEYHVPDVPATTLISIVSISDDDYFSEIYYINGSTYSEPINDLTIHVVPEPATIVLLGLGGLLLRRRK